MKTTIWIVLAAVLFGAVGFWGGVTYQKAQAPSGFSGRFGAGGPGGAGAPRPGGGITTGTVIAQDASSITVKTAASGSKTVFVSAQTEVSKQQTLATSDIKVGDQVAAFGQVANGGIDARMVQIVPPGGSFRFGGFGGGGARPSGGGGSATGQ
jgi:hypothetical protein